MFLDTSRNITLGIPTIRINFIVLNRRLYSFHFIIDVSEIQTYQHMGIVPLLCLTLIHCINVELYGSMKSFKISANLFQIFEKDGNMIQLCICFEKQLFFFNYVNIFCNI